MARIRIESFEAMDSCMDTRIERLPIGLAIVILAWSLPGIPGQILAQSAPDYRKPPSSEWPLVGGDWGNTRYSTLAKINTTNIKTLKKPNAKSKAKDANA